MFIQSSISSSYLNHHIFLSSFTFTQCFLFSSFIKHNNIKTTLINKKIIMRRPPVPLPTNKNSTEDPSSSSTTETESDPTTATTAATTVQQSVVHHHSTAPSSSSSSKPPLPATQHHQNFARPKLGHLPPTSNQQSHHQQQTGNSSGARPPLMGKMPDFGITTVMPSQQQQKQNHASNAINPLFPRTGSNPFPKFTRDSDTTTSHGTTNNRNINSNNAAFEFYINLPTTKKEETNDKDEKQDEPSDSDDDIDIFFVRLWGPKYLFSGDNSDQSFYDIISSRHHRLVVFLHGAGMSGMCFHLLACTMLGINPSSGFKKIAEDHPVLLNKTENEDYTNNIPVGDNTDVAETNDKSNKNSADAKNPQLICIAFDYRCHGKTKMVNKEAPTDLDSFALDVTRVTSRMLDIGTSLRRNVVMAKNGNNNNNNNNNNNTNNQSRQHPELFWAPDQSFCLIGHSVGGSVACAVSEIPEWRQKLFGLVLLDIVEGTALESIRHMPDFLKRRPRSFASENEAVNWFVRFGGMRMPESAHYSVPSLLEKISCDEGEGAKEEEKHNKNAKNNDKLTEDKNDDDEKEKFVWITDLAKTEPYWHTWFNGMDGRFLHAVCPRMLCLSSRDTMDKDLTVAHMQGQFQLEIFRDCGHYLMEDQPAMVAPVLMKFISRIEQQNETLKAVYMKKYGTSSVLPTSSSSSTTTAGPAAVAPRGGGGGTVLGTPQSTVPQFYYPTKSSGEGNKYNII